MVFERSKCRDETARQLCASGSIWLIDGRIDRAQASGELQRIWQGELEDADISVVLDYATAKAIFVDLDSQVAIQAFMAGKIKVTGDLTKLMALQGTIAPNETGAKIAQLIKDITA